MKRNLIQSRLVAAAAGLFLAASAGVVSAQAVPTMWIATFDNDISAVGAIGGNESALTTIAWDGAMDAPGGPNTPSGSLYATIKWPVIQTPSSWTWQEVQLPIGVAWPGTDISTWVDVEMDIKVDLTNSCPDMDGNFGNFYFVGQSWSDSPGWNQFAGTTISTNAGTGWQHIKTSLASLPSPWVLNQLVLDINSQRSTNSTLGMSYWIDNVKITAQPLPLPELNDLQSATPPGLTLIPATSGEYQRVMVYPNEANLGTDLGWYNHATTGNPVSYSFTLSHFPPQGNYQAQLFLIPNATMAYGVNDTAVDWNCTNDFILNISANNNSPALATSWNVSISVKTNLAGANPNLTITNFAYPQLPNGTWTLTFTDNSHFTLMPPNPTNAVSGEIDPATLALVTGAAAGNTALTPYFGTLNASLTNIGVPCVYSALSIQGTSTNLSDNFASGVFNTSIWSKLSDEPADILVTTSDLLGYLSWNTPNDQGFQTVAVASSLAGPWTGISGSTNWFAVSPPTGLLRETLLSKAAVHAALNGAETNAAFFRLAKFGATRLQVLLPGESNAPGTPTGKSGSPDPETQWVPFDITVNAVDNQFNLISSVTDTVTFTSNDPAAGLPLDTPLVGGTLTLPGGAYFGTLGTWTITATDTATIAIAPGTSTAVTITH